MIVTPEIWSAWSNQSIASAGDLASLNVICRMVDQAIKKKLKRTIEQTTYVNLIFDAPDTPYILLQRYAPIAMAGFSCYYNDQANGNLSAFTLDTLLTPYSDYRLDTDPTDPTLSPGNLERIGTIWGINYRRRPTQLSLDFVPNAGAVMLNFTGGYATVPDDLMTAACLMVTLVLRNREHGFMKGSESWNGYSYNLPGVGLMIHGLLGNPDVHGFLLPYMNYSAMIG